MLQSATFWFKNSLFRRPEKHLQVSFRSLKAPAAGLPETILTPSTHTHSEGTGSKRQAEPSLQRWSRFPIWEPESEGLQQTGDDQEQLHFSQLLAHAHPAT
ncbi:hypothetical protein CHARACLAT_030185 [Characodon lateralis]|uniref:Uncharacterized protein n=1 Tax=Characodon lateralis TaxID=208331 RepID=A0ABU7EY43_9TELE|nr:hypothetical protein [Characodon lateralis]